MARELNREIFAGRAAVPSEQGTAVPRTDDIRILQLNIDSLNKRLMDFESRLETMNTKVEDMLRTNKQRFERVQGHFQNQNEMVKNGFTDIHGKIAHVVSRVNERKVADGVVKDMVERSTQLVQGFEVRLQQLQRIINEQELQLTNARSQLKDTLLELSRLKK